MPRLHSHALRRIFWLLLGVWLVVGAAPARAVVAIDPRLAEELRARGVLEAVLQRVRAARDRGFFEMPPMVARKLPSETTTWHTLVILVDFSDRPQSGDYGPSAWGDHLFAQHSASTESVTDIYLDNSYGDFLITGQVVGWYRMPHPYSYYCNGDGIEGTADDYGLGDYPQNAQGLAEDAVDAADPDVDYHDFLNDRWAVDGVFVIHAGTGAEQTGDADDIWSHQSSIYHDTDDGVTVRSYTTEPELRVDGGMTDVGVFAHEFGHILGLPDLYDTDLSSDGVGRWSLMSIGMWNGGGAHPSDFDAWSKVQLGFVEPTVITVEGDSLVLPPVETEGVVYKLHTDAMGDQEYFLLENRQPLHNDAWLPGSGMLVWHVDEAVNTNQQELCVPDGSAHPLLRLLQADGRCDLENKDGSDAGDPFPGSAMNQVLDSMSLPASLAYSGHKSNVAMKRIREITSNVVFDLRFTDVLLTLVPDTFPTLSQALAVAGDGDEVRIRAGLVCTGNHVLAAGVHLSGGWNADYSTQDPQDPSILVGEAGASLLRIDGVGSLPTRLDHLVLRNGDGDSVVLPEEGRFGGAIHVTDACLQLGDCRFEDNEVGNESDPVARGGAIAAYQSELEITDCSFQGNRAQEAADLYLSGGQAAISGTAFEGGSLYSTLPMEEKRGGAILALNARLHLSDCTVQGYAQARDGGAIHAQGDSVIVEGTSIVGCSCSGNGGAIHCVDGSLRISASTVSADSAGALGGGLYLEDSSLDWQGGTLSANLAQGMAGGLYQDGPAVTVSMEAVAVLDNRASTGVGGLYLNAAEADLQHCVFRSNRVDGSGHGGVYLAGSDGSWRNDIFAANLPDAAGGTVGSGLEADYNLYWENGDGEPLDGIPPGQHDVAADPLFVDAGAGDLHLGQGSPAIDAGDPLSPLDFDESLPDLGLYGGTLDDGDRPVALVSPRAEGLWLFDGLRTQLNWEVAGEGSWPVDKVVFRRPRLGSGPGTYFGSTTGTELLDMDPPSQNEYLVQGVDARGRAGSPGQWFRVEATGTPPPARRFTVGQPFPNPFNPSTRLRFTLAQGGWVKAQVVDAAGRRVALLADGPFTAGEHVLSWQGRDAGSRTVASGVYWLRLESEEGSAVRRLLLLK